MDPATIVGLSSAIGGALIGAIGGRINALQGLAAINQLLQSTIDNLQTEKTAKDAAIQRLENKVESLEGLVTQKAEVAQLHVKVDALTGRVEAIATKVGA